MSSSLGSLFLHSKSFEACDRTWIWFLTTHTQSTEVYIAHTPSLFFGSRPCVQMLFPSLPVSLLNFKIQRIQIFFVSKYYSEFDIQKFFGLRYFGFLDLVSFQSCSKNSTFQLKNESDIRSWEKFEFRGSNYLIVRYWKQKKFSTIFFCFGLRYHLKRQQTLAPHAFLTKCYQTHKIFQKLCLFGVLNNFFTIYSYSAVKRPVIDESLSNNSWTKWI